MKKQTVLLYGYGQHNGIELNGVSDKDLIKLNQILHKYNGKARSEEDVLRGYRKNKAPYKPNKYTKLKETIKSFFYFK